MNKIFIAISVDWEGEHFRNTYELKKIRKELSDYPFTHFICPAYFTQKNNNAQKKIKEIIDEKDEIALHLHCYRPLIEAVGTIEYRYEPNYYNYQPTLKKLLPSKWYQKTISGRGVPLSAYKYDEIKKIIDFSRHLLAQKLNLQEVSGFRAGGWLANDAVFEAINKLGFKYDSSAVAPEILSQKYKKNNAGNKLDDYGDNNGIFTDFVSKLWGGNEQNDFFLKNQFILKATQNKEITKKTQPFFIKNILELPDNCALSDFASIQKTWRPVFNHALKTVKEQKQDFFMCIGCHHEGSFDYKLPLPEFIKSLTNDEKKHIEFVTMKQASVQFKKEILNKRTMFDS